MTNEKSQKVVEKKNAEKRYGKGIKYETYKVTNTLILITIIIGIFLIPLQLFFEGFMKNIEDPFIINVQAALPENCLVGVCNTLLSFPDTLFDPFYTPLMMIVWYLCADSLIAFKGCLVTCIGMYMLAFLNIIYKDGRPFWNSQYIKSGNHCKFGFTSPSETSFVAFFFLTYMLVQVRYKYAAETNSTINALLVALVVLLNILTYVTGLINGLTYIYQNVMGTLTAFVYLILCLTFDKEIHRWCEKAGFILQSSRLRKFQTFFGCLIAFTAFSLYFMAVNDEWTIPQNWIINASFNNEICAVRFNQRADNKLGTNQTYDETGILFFLIGMVFG